MGNIVFKAKDMTMTPRVECGTSSVIIFMGPFRLHIPVDDAAKLVKEINQAIADLARRGKNLHPKKSLGTPGRPADQGQFDPPRPTQEMEAFHSVRVDFRPESDHFPPGNDK
ncbi:hypothetical protein [Antrihabitans spumae]|uniref:Uncharacterized protein n=1 Tax=Antrihabitans spumae TaxID=3373370 RepID=A0ABW7KSI3_9NOCA